MKNILLTLAVLYAGVVFAGSYAVCDTKYADAFLICAAEW